MIEVKQPKCYMLDWKALRVFDNTTHKSVLIDKDDTLVNVDRNRRLLNEILQRDLGQLNNSGFKKLVNERFGSMTSFYEMLDDMENFTESPEYNATDEFDASKH